MKPRCTSGCFLALALATAVPVAAQICPGTRGDDLLACLRANYTPDQTLGYDQARDVLFRDIYGGTLDGIYTGFTITLDPAQDPSADAAGKGVNTEHAFPQSMGAAAEPARSDMHHLFPAKDNVNSSRGNHPFDEIPDEQTDTWYRLATSQTTIPEADIDAYSEKDDDNPHADFTGRFEPREHVKGDIARAVLYFFAIYQSVADAAFFEVQREVLVAWNALDPPSQAERDRSTAIAQQQGNENPFILDATLAARVYGDSTGGGEPPTLAAGDIMIAGFNFDNPDEFAFVPLVDLEPGTEIHFTDNGWTAAGTFRSGEGVLTWMATGAVAAGDPIVISNDGGWTATVGTLSTTGSTALSTDGDQILAYQGDATTPSFLYAVNSEENAWQPDATSTSTSALPAGLVEGTTAVALTEVDNAVYTGPTNFDPATVRLLVGTPENWTGSDAVRQAMPGAFELPVELVVFSAIADGADVMLRWETASETNNAGFTVQQLHGPVSTDLGFVPGHGTSAGAQRYTYRVHDPGPGTHRFRLRQVDYNGAFAYTPEVEIGLDPLETHYLSAAYPNPFHLTTTIHVDLPRAGELTLKVYDVLGRELSLLASGYYPAGRFEVVWEGTGLPNGMYVYRLEAGDFRAAGTVILRK